MPLTVFQSLPVDGVVIVTAPQALVGMIVTKAVHMAEMLDVPVLGIVENYSFFRCPDCGKEHPVFGESTIDALGAQLSLPVLARLPINPYLARAVDEGGAQTSGPLALLGLRPLLRSIRAARNGSALLFSSQASTSAYTSPLLISLSISCRPPG